MWAIVRGDKVLERFYSLKEAQEAFPIYFEGCEFDGTVSIVDLEDRPDLAPQFGTLTR